jgi:alpha-L-rhamnosidase
MLVLAKIGRHDVAYKLLHQDTFPSWLFSIKHGATSIWERWNGWTPEQGFGDPGMNSFAHYSFGAVYQFMVENIGGIRRDKPGYEHFVIEPHFDPALQYATVRYDSIRGPIVTSWNISGEKRQFEITIPANSTAELRLPTAKASDVTESDRSLVEVIGVSDVAEQDGKVIATVGSGSYKFAFPSGVKAKE